MKKQLLKNTENMRTYKIFSLPSHQTKERTSGVDLARVIQPSKHLDGFEKDDYRFEVDIYDINDKKQPLWTDIAKKYDMVFLNYTVLDWAFAAMGAPLRGEGKKIVYDIDDSIWHVRRDNPTYEQFHANNGEFIHNVTCMLDEVDHITTTSGYLRNIVVNKTYKHHENITVLPNYIDLELYDKTFDAKDNGTITIMHYGSTTHFEDLLQKPFREALQKIMDEYPNVKFVTVGSFLPDLKYILGRRYENYFGDIDIYKWIQDKFPTFMEMADIFVSPVEPDTYNKAKSFIKYLEVSSAKVPGVYQDIYQYRQVIDDGTNGFLAETMDDWYFKLKKLIDSVKLRQVISRNAYETVQKYQIDRHVDEYATLFRKVIDK